MNTKKKKAIFGTKERPRLSVYKSLKHMHAQIIDDVDHKTLVGMSTQSIKKGTKMENCLTCGGTIRFGPDEYPLDYLVKANTYALILSKK